jgi:hypothetical protein
MMPNRLLPHNLLLGMTAVLLALQVLCTLHCHLSAGDRPPAATGFICHLPAGEHPPQPLSTLALQLVYGFAVLHILNWLLKRVPGKYTFIHPPSPRIPLRASPPLLPPPRAGDPRFEIADCARRIAMP